MPWMDFNFGGVTWHTYQHHSRRSLPSCFLTSSRSVFDNAWLCVFMSEFKTDELVKAASMPAYVTKYSKIEHASNLRKEPCRSLLDYSSMVKLYRDRNQLLRATDRIKRNHLRLIRVWYHGVSFETYPSIPCRKWLEGPLDFADSKMQHCHFCKTMWTKGKKTFDSRWNWRYFCIPKLIRHCPRWQHTKIAQRVGSRYPSIAWFKV